MHRSSICKLLCLSISTACLVGLTARARGQSPPIISVGQAEYKAAEKLYEKGRTMFKLKKMRQALVFFKRAYEMAPLPGFLFNIGQCYRFLNDVKQALFFYRQYVRDNPGTPDSIFVEKIISRLESKLRSQSRQRQKARALYEEGRKQLNLRQFPQALELFKQAYKTFPLPGYLFNLAEAHRGMGQWSEAIGFYRNYLKENPSGPQSKQVEQLIATCEKELRRKSRQDRLNLSLKDSTKTKMPIKRPFYKKWWFWTTLAVGVAAAAAGVGLGLGLRDRGNDLPQAGLGSVDWR